MSQERKSTVGDPIWVESLMTAEELREAHGLYPNTVLSGKHVEYNPNVHKGGKWRYKMGESSTPAERETYNKNLDNLCNLLKTKHFKNMKGQFGNPKLQ